MWMWAVLTTFQRYMLPPFSGPCSAKSTSYCGGLKSVTGTLCKCWTVLELVITSSDTAAAKYNNFTSGTKQIPYMCHINPCCCNHERSYKRDVRNVVSLAQ
jgi:hypothetical protein